MSTIVFRVIQQGAVLALDISPDSSVIASLLRWAQKMLLDSGKVKTHSKILSLGFCKGSY